MSNIKTIDFHTLVAATWNHGKLREFRGIFEPAGYEVLGLHDVSIDVEYEESGNTFLENARQKALAYSRHTKFPVLADDSGLEVESLSGRPGIYSARYAGPGASDSDRMRKLLDELKECGGGREARFVCALVLAQEGAVLLEAEGKCLGVIAEAPRGAKGFGYDPVFLIPELGKTYAELDDEEKHRRSHRGQAAASILQQLGKFSIVSHKT